MNYRELQEDIRAIRRELKRMNVTDFYVPLNSKRDVLLCYRRALCIMLERAKLAHLVL